MIRYLTTLCFVALVVACNNEASKELKPKNNILAVATYDSILNLSRSETYKIAQYEKQKIIY